MTQTETTPETTQPTGPSRRQVLVTGSVVAAAVALTTACGSTTTTDGGDRASSGAGSSGSGSTVATTDVPVGGGVVLEAKQVVITQPTVGTFKAFSAVCTHEGCIVSDVANGTITCQCHRGQFSASDGSVQGGPPPAPLAEVAITVSGTTITLA